MTSDSCFPHTRTSVPAPCGVPPFDPLRVRGGRLRLRRALRRRRRAPAAVLAVTAATLAAAGVAGADDLVAQPQPRPAAQERHRPPAVPLVSAPVRIADAETVRLLRPGDRVDVIAAPGMTTVGVGGGSGGSEARVVASGVRVAEVPGPGETRSDGGALVVLSVPRPTAVALAGAGMTSQLAVTLC
ncbi:hypothetical protein [Streptomyces showdoensis]|uniref:Flp pilus assembly protein RcpC/CpaB domain-containing protein n=1 Tax=Streptomyces showdoensis TaxID=68268 RepID=A0A2P2GTY8_STREW|nr:hypothetical protein [Streptomyces showdoensis]KKZ74375.1 hypothetical protein VO63_08020 [Streptomyces showdoensis]